MFQNSDTFSMPNSNAVPDPASGATPPSTNPAPAQNPPSAPVPPVPSISLETGFMDVLAGTGEVIKKKIGLFLGGTILNFVLVFGVIILAGPAIIGSLSKGVGATIGMVLIIGLLLALVSYLFYGSMSHQAASAIHDTPVKFMESLSLTFKNTGKTLYVLFKIFVYTRIWLVLAIMVLSALLMAFASSLGFMLVTIMNFVLGAAVVVVIIYASIRSFSATLVLPLLMSEPDLSAQDALDRGLELTKGKWWLTICFLTIFSFLLTVIPGLLDLLGVMTKNSLVTGAATIVGLVFGVMSYTMTLSFFQVMVDRLGDPTRLVKLHIGMLLGTLVIFLLPVIITVGLPLLGLHMIGGLTNDSDRALLKSMPYDSLTSQKSVSQSVEPVKVLTAEEKEAAKKSDALRIEDANKLVAAVEKYHAEKGIYPSESHCVSKFSVSDWNYLQGFQKNDQVKYLEINAELKFPDRRIMTCSTPIYQNLTGENYALFVKMADPANGNIDQFFGSLEEAQKFQPSATGGQYFTVVHLAGVADTVSADAATTDTVTTNSATVTTPRVPRVKRQ